MFSDIKNFHPKDCQDFADGRPYWVRWKPEEDAESDETSNVKPGPSVRPVPVPANNSKENWYKAQILLLGNSHKELEEKIEKTRVRVSKVLDSSIEESSDESPHGSSVSQISKQRKESKKLEASAKSKALRQVLSEKMESRKRCLPFASSKFDNTKKDASGNRSVTDKIEQLVKKTAELESVNAQLAKENEEFKILNKKLQQALLGKLSAKCSGNCKNGEFKPTLETTQADPAIEENVITSPQSNEHFEEGPTPSKVSKHSEEDSDLQVGNDSPTRHGKYADYEEVGEKVHLGNDIFIPTTSWEMLQVQKRNSVFLKNLAVSVWVTSNLKGRSIEGKICPCFKDKSPRPPLTPVKLCTVKKCFEDRLRSQKLDSKSFRGEAGKFKKYITEKIMDINRTERKRIAQTGSTCSKNEKSEDEGEMSEELNLKRGRGDQQPVITITL